MATYVVTGGAGFIGSHLCEELSKEHKVIIVDNNDFNYRRNIIKLESLSINFSCISADSPELESFICSCDGVFHLAAQAEVQTSIDDFYNSTVNNIIPTINILNICQKNDVPIVFASSSAIYDESNKATVETAGIMCASPYAADKYSSEVYAKSLVSVLPNFSFLAFRFFNVYGERQDPSSDYSGVISKFIEWLKEKIPLTIVGGGNQTRDFIYVKDVVHYLMEGMKYLLSSPPGIFDVFNVCTGKSISINELARLIFEILDETPSTISVPKRDGDPILSLGDPEKLNGKFPHNTLEFKEGLSKILLHEGLLKKG